MLKYLCFETCFIWIGFDVRALPYDVQAGIEMVGAGRHHAASTLT
jgi:hypothetical protein